MQSPQRTLRRGSDFPTGFPGNLRARLHFVWGVGRRKISSYLVKNLFIDLAGWYSCWRWTLSIFRLDLARLLKGRVLLQESWESSCFGLVRWVPPLVRGACLVQWIYILFPLFPSGQNHGSQALPQDVVHLWPFGGLLWLGSLVKWWGATTWGAGLGLQEGTASWHLVAIFLGELVVQMLIRTPQNCVRLIEFQLMFLAGFWA